MPRRVALASLALLLTCCTSGTPTTGTGGKAKATPTPTPTAPVSPPAKAVVSTGRVLDLKGLPAAGVPVRSYLIGNNGGSVIANNGAGFRLLAAASETKTAADGTFTLAGDAGQAYNLEAEQAPDVKSFKANVQTSAHGLELRLDYTGAIGGKVTAPGAPTLKDFEGVDVFIPGTSYTGKAAKDGSYTLSNVPVGTFQVVATKAGVGRAATPDVTVTAKQTTAAPDLNLALTAPELSNVEPPAGAPGATLVLKGAHFGTDAGKPVQVTVGGVVVAAPRRKDDGTIEIEVPEAAASGSVIVAVEGVASAPKPFYVIKALVLGAVPTTLLAGATQQLAATGTGFDGKPVEGVLPAWKADGPAVTVDAKGLVTAAAVGKASVTATLGKLTASVAFEVVASLAKVAPFGGGTFTGPGRMAAGPDGTLYLLDGGKVIKIPSGGTASQLAASFTSPEGLAYDPAGRLIVVDTGANAAKAMTLAGVASALPDATLSFPRDAAVDATGTIFLVDDINYAIKRITPAGAVSTLVAFDKGGFSTERLRGMAIDAGGTLYVCDQNRIMAITPAGQARVLAGGPQFGLKDGPATEAQFNTPADVLPDGAGGLYVADALNHAIRKIDLATGAVSTVAGNGTAGDVDGLGAAARFSHPAGLALVGATLVVADRDNAKLRAITFVSHP
ncbi:MAG: hypothetical protein JWM80_1834 [Cyanobacteria bacterium RYN_339]|nr:hypothetical protein [Cyanobacteria bacterium RYN_339]